MTQFRWKYALASALAATALICATPASARTSGIDPNGSSWFSELASELIAFLGFGEGDQADLGFGADPNGRM